MDAQPKPRSGRSFKIVLALSLALNLLFVGLIAGAAYRHGGKGAHAGPSLHSYGAPYMRALPVDQRRALNRAMRAADAIPSRRERQGFYREVLEGLRAESFDGAAVEAAMLKQREIVTKVQAAAQVNWLQIVSTMTREERMIYADALEERLKRGPRKRGGKKERN